MKRNQGFTLIELIIVIVILGILAVTAAPRFLNFASDARASALDGARGAMASAGSLVYGKAVIAGLQNGNACLAANGNVVAQTAGACAAGQIEVVDGFPAATIASVRNVAELDAAEWDVVLGTGADAPGFGATDTSVIISPAGVPVSADQADACHAVYQQSAGGGAKPVITVHANGC
ncbi:prepilin-type N-terminal cleavage/methylation domain-containing protein [Rheinheimera aquimaris]|uniref:prepilin-type N-terminal cleavage/methylation domain-containing protein n=1 Tax=Rheinheimera aquimaris TaxID=412437 RepID=UPI003A980C79